MSSTDLKKITNSFNPVRNQEYLTRAVEDKSVGPWPAEWWSFFKYQFLATIPDDILQGL